MYITPRIGTRQVRVPKFSVMFFTIIYQRNTLTLMANKLPKELQANIRSLRFMCIVMAICGLITVVGIPWALLYIVLAASLRTNRLPNRLIISFAAFVTIPICIFLAPV